MINMTFITITEHFCHKAIQRIFIVIPAESIHRMVNSIVIGASHCVVDSIVTDFRFLNATTSCLYGSIVQTCPDYIGCYMKYV